MSGKTKEIVFSIGERIIRTVMQNGFQLKFCITQNCINQKQ